MHCNKMEVNEENEKEEGGRGSQKHEKNSCDTSPPHFFHPPVRVSQFVKRCVEIWSDIFFSLKNFFVTFFFTERDGVYFLSMCVCVTFLCVHKNELFSVFTQRQGKQKRRLERQFNNSGMFVSLSPHRICCDALLCIGM